MQLTQSNATTTLPQRLFFNEALNKALLQAKRHQKVVALMLINVDGGENTPSLLEALNRRFSSVLRASDSLAHLENDEFALLLTDLEQPALAATVAEKLLKAGSLPIQVESHTFHFAIRIAIALFPEDGQTLETLQKSAEDALHQAKQQGGNHYCFAQPHRTTEAQDYLQLQAAMSAALRNKEFLLYYQPILDLKTGSLHSVEALIRWKHPPLGLIDPLQFIPSAEATNLIIEIGEWALWEACRDNKTWQNDGYQPIKVAVNLSPKQFYHPGLCETIRKALQETALNSRYLELEINEMTLLDDLSKVTPLLATLKSAGLTLALDDFGTGHTSLASLKTLPLDTLKIDQSFIKSLPGDAESKALITTLITFAHHLGAQVVAEGIETLEQLQLLAQLGCDQGQGYFISPPLPASKVVTHMQRN